MSNERDLTEQVAEIIIAAGWHSRGDAQWTNLRDALPKLRELFPPMAKALVWRIDGDDICSQHVDFEWYRIRNFPSCAPSDDLLINCALCGIRSANSLQWCMTIDEAKAWCESRHQALFLEQLA